MKCLILWLDDAECVAQVFGKVRHAVIAGEPWRIRPDGSIQMLIYSADNPTAEFAHTTPGEPAALLRIVLVYYPDEGHWILKPQNSLHWYGEVMAWLERHLGRRIPAPERDDD